MRLDVRGCSRSWKIVERGCAAIRHGVAGPEALVAVISDRADGLEGTVCPVVIARGTRDRLLAPRQGRRLVARIPAARLVELAGAGHVAMSDDPELVAGVILEMTASKAAYGEGVADSATSARDKASRARRVHPRWTNASG